jgi:hypothetical protein
MAAPVEAEFTFSADEASTCSAWLAKELPDAAAEARLAVFWASLPREHDAGQQGRITKGGVELIANLILCCGESRERRRCLAAFVAGGWGGEVAPLGVPPEELDAAVDAQFEARCNELVAQLMPVARDALERRMRLDTRLAQMSTEPGPADGAGAGGVASPQLWAPFDFDSPGAKLGQVLSNVVARAYHDLAVPRAPPLVRMTFEEACRVLEDDSQTHGDADM